MQERSLALLVEMPQACSSWTDVQFKSRHPRGSWRGLSSLGNTMRSKSEFVHFASGFESNIPLLTSAPLFCTSCCRAFPPAFLLPPCCFSAVRNATRPAPSLFKISIRGIIFVSEVPLLSIHFGINFTCGWLSRPWICELLSPISAAKCFCFYYSPVSALCLICSSLAFEVWKLSYWKNIPVFLASDIADLRLSTLHFSQLKISKRILSRAL